MRRILAATAVVLLASGCAAQAPAAEHDIATDLGHEVTSGDGFVGGFVEGAESGGVQMIAPVVYDAEGEVVFADEDTYSTRHGVGLVWQPSEAGPGEDLWILSSDLGAARIANTDGVWVKVWADGELPDGVRDLIDG